MAGRIEQTIKDWTIRRKILTGFCGVLACTAPNARPGIRAAWMLATMKAPMSYGPTDSPWERGDEEQRRDRGDDAFRAEQRELTAREERHARSTMRRPHNQSSSM